MMTRCSGEASFAGADPLILATPPKRLMLVGGARLNAVLSSGEPPSPEDGNHHPP